ncbi:MAG: restriction endonuclease subunit S [Parabacteroides sp.]|nr:restriction endonuclease subunit S [Parabacteroides sp.]
MGEWKEYKLGELGTVVTGKTPSSKNPEDWGDDMFFVTPTDYRNYRKYVDGSERKLSDIGVKRLANKILPPYSVLVTCIGSDMGKVVITKDPCITNQQINSIIPNESVDPHFLYYTLINSYDVLRVMGGDGTAVPIVNKRDFENIKIEIPSLEEQKRIAFILSSLDDKIDLLHQENKTLEAMAETLFRKWFIEEAKEEWEEKTLYDCISLVGGGTPKTNNETYWNGNISWISGGDISNNHKGYIIDTDKNITLEGLNNSSTKLLPENAFVISARGTVGKYCLLSKPMTFSQSNYGVLPKEHGCYFFTYLLVSYCVDELQSAAYGSVFDTITINTFKGINIFIPSEKEIIIFENRIKDFFGKIKLNTEQIRELTTIKELLLLRLMSNTND